MECLFVYELVGSCSRAGPESCSYRRHFGADACWIPVGGASLDLGVRVGGWCGRSLGSCSMVEVRVSRCGVVGARV